MLLLLLLGKWSITAVACWSNYKTSSDFIEERCCKLNGLLLESQGKGSLRNSSQSVCDAAGDVLLLLWYIHYRRDFLNTFQWTDYKLLMRPCNGGSLLMMMLVGGPSLQSCLLFRWGPNGSLFFSFFLENTDEQRGVVLLSQRATLMNLIRINPLCKRPWVASFIDSPKCSEIQILLLVAD